MFLNDKKFVGQKIKSYRKMRNYTQAELAEKVGISEKHLSKIETGLHYPSIHVFWQACEILKIPMSEFGINTERKQDNIKRNEIIKKIYSMDDIELDFLQLLINSTIENFTIKAKSWLQIENYIDNKVCKKHIYSW